MVIMDEQYNGIQLDMPNTSPCVLKNGNIHVNGSIQNSTNTLLTGIQSIGHEISTGIKSIPSEIHLLKDRVVNKNYFLLDSDQQQLAQENQEYEILNSPEVRSISSEQLIRRPIGIKDNDTGLDSFSRDCTSPPQSSHHSSKKHRFRSLSSPNVAPKNEALVQALENSMYRSLTLRPSKSNYQHNIDELDDLDELDEDEELRIRSFSMGANDPNTKSKPSTLDEVYEYQEMYRQVKEREQREKEIKTKLNNSFILVSDNDSMDVELELSEIISSPKSSSQTTPSISVISSPLNVSPNPNNQLEQQSTPPCKSSQNSIRVPSPLLITPPPNNNNNNTNNNNNNNNNNNTKCEPPSPKLKPVPPPRSPFSLQNSMSSLPIPTTTFPTSSPTSPNLKPIQRKQLSSSTKSLCINHSSNELPTSPTSPNRKVENIKKSSLLKSRSSDNLPSQQKQQQSGNQFQNELKQILSRKDNLLREKYEQKKKESSLPPKIEINNNCSKEECLTLAIQLPMGKKINRQFSVHSKLTSLKEYVEWTSLHEPEIFNSQFEKEPHKIIDYQLCFTLQDSGIKISNFNITFKEVIGDNHSINQPLNISISLV